MATPTFDPAKFKATTREQWQEAAEAWDRWGPTLEDWLGPATEAMLDGAGVRAGARVLDVAAGAGGQTLAAARRVGPAGHVLATDLSPAILEYAAAAARSAGLENVETRELDGESLAGVEDESVDAVISRLGLIYFPDQQGALAEMRRVLRPGGATSRRRMVNARERPVLLGGGRNHPPPGRAGTTPARSAGTVQPRQRRSPRSRVRAGRFWRCQRPGRTVTATHDLGCRVPTAATGIPRRPAPNAGRPRRGRSRSGLARGWRGARRVRRRGWLYRPCELLVGAATR